MLNILGKENSVFNQFLSELRDVTVQKDRMRFRKNLERAGEIFAYEISKMLGYEKREIETPLGITQMDLIKEQPVIGTILRAGLPLQQGLLNYFDDAEVAFISAYRQYNKNGTFDVQVEYRASPDINNKVLILADPMLATGSSLVLAYQAFLQAGKPKKVHVVAVIASVEGIDYVKKHLPEDVSIWAGAVDQELTAHAFIVPGLGDAGDLAFGSKL